MGLHAVKILKISITKNSKNEILEYIQKYLLSKSKKPLIIVTPNPEQVVLAQSHNRFTEILNQADIAIPDGVGIAIATGVKRIPGVEFMEDLVAIAANRSYIIGLIGGRNEVAVDTLECLQQKYKNLNGWAIEPEKFGQKDIRKKIIQTKAKIVFVGLGAPKQEFFMHDLCAQYTNLTGPLVLMAVGGSFDLISGRITRAPVVWRSIGLEWFWRLLKQPWRIKRQIALARFLLLVFLQKISV